MIGYVDYDVSKHPKVHEWHQRILAIPEVKEAHKLVIAGIEKFKKQRAKL